MENLFFGLAMVAILAFIVGLVMLLIKGRRRRGRHILLASFVIFFASSFAGVHYADKNARALGFLDLQDKQLADSFGITNATGWDRIRDNAVRARQERLEREAEAQRIARETRAAEREAVAQHRQERLRRESERAAERRATEAFVKERRAAEAADEERRKGFHCLSQWDGSHRDLARSVIDSLNDPRSFQHVDTLISSVYEDGTNRILMTFRARNGFGGMVVNHVQATMRNSDCTILEWALQ